MWSIRKNVQVSQATKKGTVLNANKSSSTYYSRHGGLSGEQTSRCCVMNGAIYVQCKDVMLVINLALNKP